MKLLPPQQLTKKQMAIIEAIAEDGLSVKMIAANLDKSTHTINNTLRLIYAKLNINSNTELVRWWFQTQYQLPTREENIKQNVRHSYLQ